MTDGREPIVTRRFEPNPIKISCSSGWAGFWPGRCPTDRACKSSLWLYRRGRFSSGPTFASLDDWSLAAVAAGAKQLFSLDKWWTPTQ
jgi:hypothetical protein